MSPATMVKPHLPPVPGLANITAFNIPSFWNFYSDMATSLKCSIRKWFDDS